jgi:hypothetical protein
MRPTARQRALTLVAPGHQRKREGREKHEGRSPILVREATKNFLVLFVSFALFVFLGPQVDLT